MKALRVLVVEDSEDDFLLLRTELEANEFVVACQRVDTAVDLTRALEATEWDLVISDYSMPQFTALDALEIVRGSQHSDLPFIIVSGSIGEESAVAALKAGASNYMMKGNMAQLVPIVERELKDAQVRRERREAFAALELAVKSRDEFLSIASHELKTPLAALRLQAESLLRVARRESGALLDSEQVLSRLESIERSAQRLSHLVERLLDITRVMTGHLDVSRGQVDLVQLVHDVVAQMSSTFRDAGCEVSVIAPHQLLGMWDRERIANVVTDLLSNAAKYGARKPIVVELEDIGDHARIRVIDRGIGISEPDQQRIFGRFERAVPEKHYGGLGIGLWLTKQVVDAHGGTIAVRSNMEDGSTFTVALPKGAP